MDAELRNKIRSTAETLAENGCTPETIRARIASMTGVYIGEGGKGPGDGPPCPVCGAEGNGGHGGMCPDA